MSGHSKFRQYRLVQAHAPILDVGQIALALVVRVGLVRVDEPNAVNSSDAAAAIQSALSASDGPESSSFVPRMGFSVGTTLILVQCADRVVPVSPEPLVEGLRGV